MGNVEDDDAGSKPIEDNWNFNFNLTDTQSFDSQNFPSSLPGKGEKEEDDYHMKFLRSDVLVGDTVPVEDALDTQILDLGGETQLLDFPDCFMDTQLIDEFNSDGEGSDTTEVLDGSEGLSDADNCRRDNFEPLDVEVSKNVSFVNEKNKTVEKGDENRCSSFGQKFTALRAASFRASGLAAKKAALEKTKSGSDKQALESNVADIKSFEKTDQMCDVGGYSDEVVGLINEKSAKTGGSTARKLFVGDCFDETEMLPSMDDNNFGENEMLQMPICANEMAGLSYIDSQEPGESTQENALACVDKLIEENRVLLDEFDMRNSTKGKSNLSSTANGAVSLAKKNNQRGISVKSTVFDWDDGQEDEGGGDIFLRKKEEFLGSKRLGEKSLAKRLKASGNQADNANYSSKIPVDGLKMNGKKATEAEVTVKRTLVDEFDEEHNKTSSAGQLEAAEDLAVGLDTQMAAEAMEALIYADFVAGDTEPFRKGSTGTKGKKSSLKKRPFIEDDDVRVATAKSRRKVVGEKTRKKPSTYQRQSANVNLSINGVMTRGKRTRADSENGRIKEVDKLPVETSGLVVDGLEETALTESSFEKQNLLEEFAMSTPVAHRTRQGSAVSKSKDAESLHNGLAVQAAKMLDTKGKSSDLFTIESPEFENSKSKSTTVSDGISCPKRRRSCRQLSAQCNKSDAKQSDQLENVEKSLSIQTRSQKNGKITSAGCLNRKSYKPSTQGIGESSASKDNVVKDSEKLLQDKMTDASLKASSVLKPVEPCKSTCTTPGDILTPVNAASPVIVGDEHSKRSCKRSLSNSFVNKEISSLYDTRPTPVASPNNTRKRRDLATVRILFSQHLDKDIIKQQTKIVERLKLSMASSITDATHFIANEFVRTRNMLEAIASGKFVVTHLWLENVGRAKYYVDEQKYILRDSKKEKELGFNMQVSLAYASQHPLLLGRKVLITPSAKPNKETLAGLVKTVGGQAIERVGRSTLKDETIPDDLLILSCEEDYEVCVPFLKKGAAVYSSELLLNGIVTQKLEYARYELFADNVKKTRSTIWLKKAGNSFSPVTKQRL